MGPRDKEVVRGAEHLLPLPPGEGGGEGGIARRKAGGIPVVAEYRAEPGVERVRDGTIHV